MGFDKAQAFGVLMRKRVSRRVHVCKLGDWRFGEVHGDPAATSDPGSPNFEFVGPSREVLEAMGCPEDPHIHDSEQLAPRKCLKAARETPRMGKPL